MGFSDQNTKGTVFGEQLSNVAIAALKIPSQSECPSPNKLVQAIHRQRENDISLLSSPIPVAWLLAPPSGHKQNL